MCEAEGSVEAVPIPAHFSHGGELAAQILTKEKKCGYDAAGPFGSRGSTVTHLQCTTPAQLNSLLSFWPPPLARERAKKCLRCMTQGCRTPSVAELNGLTICETKRQFKGATGRTTYLHISTTWKQCEKAQLEFSKIPCVKARLSKHSCNFISIFLKTGYLRVPRARVKATVQHRFTV